MPATAGLVPVSPMDQHGKPPILLPSILCSLLLPNPTILPMNRNSLPLSMPFPAGMMNSLAFPSLFARTTACWNTSSANLTFPTIRPDGLSSSPNTTSELNTSLGLTTPLPTRSPNSLSILQSQSTTLTPLTLNTLTTLLCQHVLLPSSPSTH